MYLLDSSIFIWFHKQTDEITCQSFRKWVEVLSDIGKACSVDEVYQEIRKQNDHLKSWAFQHSYIFRHSDDRTDSRVKEIGRWCVNSDYTQKGKDSFMGSADLYLIAYALAYNCTIVTGEKPSAGKANVKIPDVCYQFEVSCLSFFEVLQKEGYALKIVRDVSSDLMLVGSRDGRLYIS